MESISETRYGEKVKFVICQIMKQNPPEVKNENTGQLMLIRSHPPTTINTLRFDADKPCRNIGCEMAFWLVV